MEREGVKFKDNLVFVFDPVGNFSRALDPLAVYIRELGVHVRFLVAEKWNELELLWGRRMPPLASGPKTPICFCSFATCRQGRKRTVESLNLPPSPASFTQFINVK